MKKSGLVLATVIQAVALFVTCAAQAADGLWTNAASGNWSDASKWVGSVPGGGGVAVFNAAAGTFNISNNLGTVTLSGLAANTNAGNAAAWVILGGTNEMVAPAVIHTRTDSLNVRSSKLSGSGDITITGLGRFYLGLDNLQTGRTIISNGNVRVARDSGFGPVPGTLVSDAIILDWGGLENDDSSFVFTNHPNRGITVTARGGFIGAGYTTAGVLINAPITGSGILGINFENNPVTLNNPANDYSGGTVVGTNGPGANMALTATLKLGQNEVLPHGAGKGGLEIGGDSSFYSTLPSAALDLNGKTETVNTLASGPRAQIASSVANQGRLIVGSLGGDSDYRGTMTGGATIEKQGNGVLTLVGANISGGTVEAKAGTVVAGGPNCGNGTLLFNGGDMELAAPSGLHEFYGAGGASIDLGAALAYSGWRLWPDKASETQTAVFPNNRQYVYRGRWHLAEAGTYSFAKSFDDAGYLAVDGNLLISNIVSSAKFVTNDVALAAGWHTVELRVAQATSGVGPQNGFRSGILFDPTNSTFATPAQIAAARMFTDDGGASLVADGYDNVLAARLILARDATLTADGTAGRLVFAGTLTTNAVVDPEPVLTIANGGAPLLFGSAGASPAVLDAAVSSAGGLVFTNRVWLRRLPSGTYDIAAGADLALDGAALLGDTALNLIGYSVRVVRGDSVGGDGSVTANAGTTVWFDTMRFANSALTNDASAALVCNNGVTLNGGTAGFAGPGTVTYSGAVSGTGNAVKSGTGDALITGTGSSLNGEFRIDAGRLRPASALALGGAAVRVSGGRLANMDGQDLTLSATPVYAQDGGFEAVGAGYALTLNGAVTGVSPVSKWGAGTLVLGGSAINTNFQLYVRGGPVELAKNGPAANYAVLNLLGIQSNSLVRLTGSNGNQIGGNVVLDGGTLDLNGISEAVGILTNTVAGGAVTNGGPQAATLTVGEGGGSSFFTGRLADGASALTLAKTGSGTLMLASEAIAYTGGTRVEGGTLRIQRENCVTAQLLRFTPTQTRPDGTYPNTGFQISEFQVLLDGAGVSIPPGTTATAPVPASGNEMAPKAVDGSLGTKWYSSSYSSPLTVAYGQPVKFNSYRWGTANDGTGRDPITWRVEMGVAGAGVTNWYLLDAQTNYNPTTTRNAWIGSNFVVRTPFNNVIPDHHPVDVAAGARLALANLTETMESLTGRGTLLLENNSVVSLTDYSSFTGAVAGAGILALKAADGSSPSFAVRDIGVNVRNDGAADVAFLFNSPATNLFGGSLQDGAKKLGVTQSGPGLTYFSGTNSTYTGATRVEGGTVAVNGATYAKYVRFSPTLMRGGSVYEYQLSEFDLMFDGQRVAYPAGTTASTPSGASNPNEGPDKTIDGNTGTKFYTNKSPMTPLVIALGDGVFFDGYRWFTANDSTQRDPVGWTVESSADGVNWAVVDTRANQTITATRNVLAGAYDVAQLNAMNVFSDVSATTVASPGVLGVSRTRETVGSLSGDGAVRLSAAATLGINAFADAAFSGGITGTGTVVKTGAATQTLSGALAFSGTLIVESGVLDLSGATLAGVTNIVIKGGATLTGAATVSGNLTVTFEDGGTFSGSLAVSGALTVFGPVKVAVPDGAAYPFFGTLFGYASADQATRDALAAAIKPSSLPAGHAATVRVTATSARLIVAPTGTTVIIR